MQQSSGPWQSAERPMHVGCPDGTDDAQAPLVHVREQQSSSTVQIAFSFAHVAPVPPSFGVTLTLLWSVGPQTLSRQM